MWRPARSRREAQRHATQASLRHGVPPPIVRQPVGTNAHHPDSVITGSGNVDRYRRVRHRPRVADPEPRDDVPVIDWTAPHAHVEIPMMLHPREVEAIANTGLLEHLRRGIAESEAGRVVGVDLDELDAMIAAMPHER